jgi:hypothetical protein
MQPLEADLEDRAKQIMLLTAVGLAGMILAALLLGTGLPATPRNVLTPKLSYSLCTDRQCTAPNQNVAGRGAERRDVLIAGNLRLRSLVVSAKSTAPQQGDEVSMGTQYHMVSPHHQTIGSSHRSL